MKEYDEKRRKEILKALEYADKIRALGLECMVRDENGNMLDVPSIKIADSIINTSIRVGEKWAEVCAEINNQFFGAIEEGKMVSVLSALKRDGILVRTDGMIVIDPALLGGILRKLTR